MSTPPFIPDTMQETAETARYHASKGQGTAEPGATYHICATQGLGMGPLLGKNRVPPLAPPPLPSPPGTPAPRITAGRRPQIGWTAACWLPAADDFVPFATGPHAAAAPRRVTHSCEEHLVTKICRALSRPTQKKKP